MEIPLARLGKMLDRHVKETFPPGFQFRPQQREAVLDIIAAFFEGSCNLYLLEAPTGAGKSIIAMAVSSFLSEMKMRGYILASDLMLQTQYERDIERLRFDWGSIKGVDNYTCIVNHEKFSLGECKMKNTSYEEAESLPCFSDCGYLSGRKQAIRSPVSLLNYSYWLIQRNYVEGKMQESGRGVPFPKRDFALCDEAHKIPEIVQNHFSPRIDENTLDKLERIRKAATSHSIGNVRHSPVAIRTLISRILKEEDLNRTAVSLKELEMVLSDHAKLGKAMRDYVSGKYKESSQIPKEWRHVLGLIDWVKDVHCKFEDYNHIISQTGISSMIRNPQGTTLVFNCLDESYMMDRHFHSQAGFKLLMTATMGDPAAFLKAIGAKNARFFRMDSTFDFEKSPIYFYPKKRMSLSQRDRTIPWVSAKLNRILEDHPEESGIIHSGSYDITSRVMDGLSESARKRVLVYQGTQEKEKALQRFLSEPNMVLMGPSILEGLDLAEEKSRFQVFLKVPYPSLGDRFVKAKMDTQPDWYSWKTIISVLQGVGRSVRSQDDFAVTYFLDGCLSDLLRTNRSSFPQDFKKRIRVMSEDI